MKRFFVSLLALGLLAPLAQAHFIWLVPDGKAADQALLIFSDDLKPDDAPGLVDKLAKVNVYVRPASDETQGIRSTRDDKQGCYTLKLDKAAPAQLGLSHNYGVVERKGESFLLKYSAVTLIGAGDRKAPEFAAEAWKRIPLLIVPVAGKANRFQVLLDGKPLAAEADVVVLAPGKDKAIDLKTDKTNGQFTVPADDSGIYGLRVRLVEKKEGKQDDKEYKEIRHYSTMTVHLDKPETPKPNPAATKLLAEARDARAVWNNFPGFTADVTANFDGKTGKGKVRVTSKGDVTIEGMDKEFEPWANRMLSSIVSHRLPSGREEETPCAFTDDVTDHPMGRSVRVLNDELHSGYRIRDKEIVVVNRTMKDRKFTITVLESMTNKEGKFLTTSFVVDYWNLETGDLVRSEGTSQTWTRVGAFDLPARTRVVTARGKSFSGEPVKEDIYSARSLTVSNPQLLEKK